MSPVPLRRRLKLLKRAVRSAVIRATIALLATLPLRAAFALGALIGRVAWWVAPKERRWAREHLAFAFPEKSAGERDRIARASLVHLAQVAMEAVVAERRIDPRIHEYVGFEGDGEARVLAARAQGKGFILVTGHVGNWELLARRFSADTPGCGVIAKASHDPKLNALVARFRARAGIATLFREDPGTARAMIKVLRCGAGLGLLIDQDTKVQGHFVPFFGRPAFTPRAASDLALRFGSPLLVATCRRRGPRAGDGHFLRVVEIPYDPGAADREAEALRLTAACTAALEDAIRDNPVEWVWLHRRWRTTPPAEVAQAKAVPKSLGLSGS
jgi:KDO2-lipid IV(A) lauroyltransferase